MDTTLKYLYSTLAILFPYNLTKYAIAKNLIALPKIEAMINIKISILKRPAEIVNTLYGIGVNAAKNIVKNALFEKNEATVARCDSRL